MFFTGITTCSVLVLILPIDGSGCTSWNPYGSKDQVCSEGSTGKQHLLEQPQQQQQQQQQHQQQQGNTREKIYFARSQSPSSPSSSSAAAAAAATGTLTPSDSTHQEPVVPADSLLPMVEATLLRSVLKDGEHVKVGQGAAGTLYLCEYLGTFGVVKYSSGTVSEQEFRDEMLLAMALNETGALAIFYGQLSINQIPQLAYISRFIGDHATGKPVTLEHLMGDWSSGKLDPDSILDILVKVARKLEKIHEVGYFHGDVRSDNVLFDDAQEPFFTDLGQAAREEDGYAYEIDDDFREFLIQNYGYIAPELKVGGVFSQAADVFSFGYLLNVMVDEIEGLKVLTTRAMNVNPAKRATMREVVAELEDLQKQRH